MRSFWIKIFLFGVGLSGCGYLQIEEAGMNTAPILVGNCGANQYANEPCVTISVCTPGSSACVSIPNIVLDTGSYGLRVFRSLVPLSLQQITVNGGALGECSPFAQQTSDWGPVNLADVVIGGERASSVPIQLIDSTFGTLPSDCENPDISPQNSGYNGIMGVGNSIADCGSDCSSSAGNGYYFACSGGNCPGVAVPNSQQVSNPVAYMPFDNNGVTIQFPPVPTGGAPSVTGMLMLGVGTQANNTPSGVTVLPTDPTGNMVTQFQGTNYSVSFIDSGSNGIYFAANLPACGSSGIASGFYCPSTPVNFTAIQMGTSGSPSRPVTFQVANGQAELSSSELAFDNLGGSNSDLPNSFDWGLPFFMGKTIYFGLAGRSTSIGSGPFYAY